jgi:hypothetical protein
MPILILREFIFIRFLSAGQDSVRYSDQGQGEGNHKFVLAVLSYSCRLPQALLVRTARHFGHSGEALLYFEKLIPHYLHPALPSDSPKPEPAATRIWWT